MKQMLVLGSLNIDLVQRVSRLPVSGETLQGGGLEIFVGGKGANQACAAARLGAHVRMAGKIGNDVFADRIVQELKHAGVATEFVLASDSPSGTAVIFVLPTGENIIVISAGANAGVSEAFALEAIDNLQPGDLLLCQLEIPLNAVSTALEAAHQKGVITVLDPAPACALPKGLLSSVSILTPNQTEAAILLDTDDPPADFSQAERAALELRARGAEAVIVKMGSLGCFIAEQGTTASLDGYTVDVKDTTAAGDTFNGALGTGLAKGAGLSEAARFANAAAALCVTKSGAIASIPSLSTVQEFLLAQPTL